MRSLDRNKSAPTSLGGKHETHFPTPGLNRLVKRGLVWPIVLMLAALLATPWLSMAAQLKWVLWLAFGLTALSLNLVWGKAGIFSFGQNALFGIGAYAYAIVALNVFPVSHETGSAIVAAVVVAALFAALLGYVMFYGRIGDVYLSIVTLAVTLVIYTVISGTAGPQYRIGEALLGGFNGMPSLPSVAIGWPGSDSTTEMDTTGLYQFSICVAGLVYMLVKFIATSRPGAILAGLRENEARMDLLGYDTRLAKLLVFTFGGAIAGLGGALFAAWGTFVNPSIFSLAQAALIVIWVMVGGRGSLGGAFVGVILVQWVADEADKIVSQQTPLILGVLLILCVLLLPGGVAPLLQLARDALVRTLPTSLHFLFGLQKDHGTDDLGLDRSLGVVPPAARQNGSMTAKAIFKNFGGLSVLRGVSLKFGGPGVHVVIGANGAGKSTFFGVLTGRHAASGGEVELNGRTVTRMLPYLRAKLGLGIKMQTPSLFPALTVRENLQLACHGATANLPSRHTRRILQLAGLLAKMDETVSELSHGEQQWLDIAMVLAQNPSVILLDEPAAGMTSTERKQMVLLIRELGTEHTVVVVEHDMAFIRDLEAPLAMLHQGEVFRLCSFKEMTSDPEVINVYLGRRHVAQS